MEVCDATFQRLIIIGLTSEHHDMDQSEMAFNTISTLVSEFWKVTTQCTEFVESQQSM